MTAPTARSICSADGLKLAFEITSPIGRADVSAVAFFVIGPDEHGDCLTRAKFVAQAAHD